jgi:glycerate 2-kinase
MLGEELKPIVRRLYDTALESANPRNSVVRHVKRSGSILDVNGVRYNLEEYGNVYVVGAGKAVAGMANALEEILGGGLSGGCVSTSHGSGGGIGLNKIMLNEAGHPIPDDSGVNGARRILKLLQSTGEKDLVFYLASGGGSALLTLPADGISLHELQETTKLLLKSGASIGEVNAVRKHLDLVKGGQIARAVFPSTLISLVLSDVVGDHLDVISSGPTVPDSSTFRDAYEVLDKYGLLEEVPESVRGRIEAGVGGGVPETPKEGDPCFEKTVNVLVGGNRTAVDAMAEKAKELGYDVIVLEEPVVGEAREAAREQARKAVKLAEGIGRPLFILSGGETTVTIRGDGKGGRNQEYALAFALELESLEFERFICLSCSTDGVDNIREAAGAMVEGMSIKKARDCGLNPEQLLEDNDSYRFHKPLSTLIETGPTGTNVNDVQVMAVW